MAPKSLQAETLIYILWDDFVGYLAVTRGSNLSLYLTTKSWCRPSLNVCWWISDAGQAVLRPAENHRPLCFSTHFFGSSSSRALLKATRDCTTLTQPFMDASGSTLLFPQPIAQRTTSAKLSAGWSEGLRGRFLTAHSGTQSGRFSFRCDKCMRKLRLHSRLEVGSCVISPQIH